MWTLSIFEDLTATVNAREGCGLFVLIMEESC
jgi:hypothetical protein